MPLQVCLTDAELSAYQLGMLPEGQEAATAAHLDVCARCAGEVRRLDGLTDGVIVALRHPPADVPTPRGGGPLPKWRQALDTDLLTTTAPEPVTPTAVPGYEVLEELGRGGMGVVYKARQMLLNRLVALKMIRGGPNAGPAELTRFLTEAEMVARLAHPNIVGVHEVGTYKGVPFIALEYVRGGTLADKTGRPWPARSAAGLMETIARAVDHAHRQGVIHRDLKPSNILLDPDGGPKVADFGLARLYDAGAGLTSTGAVIGTPAYMAPEMAEGSRANVGPLADVYSLGVMLYELLAGHPPFSGENPMEVLLHVTTQDPPPLSRLRVGLPRDVCTICERCLERDPKRRYTSAAELADDLRRYLNGEPIRARRVGEVERAWKWVRRRPAVALLVAAVAVSLIVGTGTSWYLARAAMVARGHAEGLATAASDAKTDAEAAAGLLAFRLGQAEAEAGRVDRGLFLMLQAMRSAPDADDFQRVVRTNMASWAERVPVLRRVAAGQWAAFLGPHGDTYAVVDGGGTYRVCDTLTGADVPGTRRALDARPGAVSRDGRRMIGYRGPEGAVKLVVIDTATGATVTIPGHLANSYTMLEFSPAADVVWVTQAVESAGGRFDRSRFYNPADAAPLGPEFADDFRLFRAGGKTVWMRFPHPNGGDIDAAASFKDVKTGAALDGCAPDLDGGDSRVRYDGRSLVTLGRDGLVRWWSPTTGQQTARPWRPTRATQTTPGALLAGGRTLVIMGTDGRLSWFDLATRRQHPLMLPIPGNVNFAVRPDGTGILVWAKDQPVRLYRMGELPAAVGVAEGRDRHFQAAVSPDHRRTYVGTAVSRHPYGLLRGAGGEPVTAVAAPATYQPVFSRDGALLATASPAETGVPPAAELRDARTGKVRARMQTAKYIHALAFSPDNAVVGVGYVGGAFLWSHGQETAINLIQGAPVGEIAFSPSGTVVVTAGRAGWKDSPSTLRMWETATGKSLGDAVPTADAARLAFGPDGTTLWTLEPTVGRLRRWTVDGGLKPAGAEAWLDRDVPAAHAAFSADAGRVMTGYHDGRVRQWDTAAGSAVGAAMSHAAPVTALAWGPGATTLAVGCEDGTAWLRDAATGLPLGPPTVHRGPVRTLSFAADGRTLLSMSADGVAIRRRLPEPVSGPADDVQTWLEAHTGERLDGEAVVLADADRWEAARRRAKAVDAPVDLRTLHQTRARDAEADGVGYRWELERLLELAADDGTTRLRRAHVLRGEGRTSEAVAQYEHVEKSRAALAQAWYEQRAAEAAHDGAWPLARWYLDRLIVARPKDHRLYARRATVHAAEGRKAEARADQRQACRLGAGRDFVMGLVDELVDEGEWAEAGRWLEADAGRGGFSLGAAQRRGLLALRSGDAARLREVCERAVKACERQWRDKSAPIDAASLVWLCALGADGIVADGPLERWTRELEDRLPEMKRDIVGTKGDETTQQIYAGFRYHILFARAAVLHRTGRHAAALERLSELEGLDRDYRGWHRPLLALVHLKMGNSGEARTWLALTHKWLADHPAGKGHWSNRVALGLLAAEAQRLLDAAAKEDF